MNKIIVHPGDGINFPKIGDYIKINLMIWDANKNVMFECKDANEEICIDIRFKSQESNLLTDLEDLIGEMSLYEKCLLIVDKTCERSLRESELIKEFLKISKEITFEIQIVDINKYPHN